MLIAHWLGVCCSLLHVVVHCIAALAILFAWTGAKLTHSSLRMSVLEKADLEGVDAVSVDFTRCGC